jgi:hypothetical protein
MRRAITSSFFLAGTVCLTVGSLALRSDATPAKARDLSTVPVSISGTKTVSTVSTSVQASEPTTMSFTRPPIGNLGNLNVTESVIAPFNIAQANTQPVEPAPTPASPAPGPAPASPPPVNIDVQSPQQLPTPEQVTPTTVDPGRSTRSGSSYIGIGANIGVLGDPSLGETGLMVYSKIGLTRYFSVRPAFTTNFVDNGTFILPATFDLAPIGLGNILGNSVSIAPYIGAGAAVNTNGDVGPLLTGGIDIPINSRFTATAGVNAGFFDNTGLGTFVGVGYNF